MNLIPSQDDPLEKEMATHFSILDGKCQGQRILVDYSPWSHKESDTTEHSTITHIYIYIYVSIYIYIYIYIVLRFPDSSVGKESTCNVGDLGSVPGLGRSPGEGKGYSIILV